MQSNTTPTSDIQVMTGVAPNLKPVSLEYIAGLSHPESFECTYHEQLPQVAGQQITDIAIMKLVMKRYNLATITLQQSH
jgi:hypothetical protein